MPVAAEKLQVVRILDLPAELCVLIYEQALTVGKVFYRPTPFEIREGRRFHRYQEYQKPNVALLRIRRQIYPKAEPMYLATNLFVLPNQFIHCWSFREHFSPQHPEIPQRALFNTSQIVDMKRKTWNESGGFLSMNAQERQLHAHGLVNMQPHYQWSEIFRGIDLFRAVQGYIELEFSNSYCLLGCCRLTCIKPDFVDRWKPKFVWVLHMTSPDAQADSEAIMHLRHEWVRQTRMSLGELEDKFGSVVSGKGVWKGYIAVRKGK